MVNAWGISSSSTSPFWVSDNGTGVATLYSVNPTTNTPVQQGLVVTIPGDGSVTGQAFSPNTPTGSFNGNAFLFVSEDGTISGWRGALGTTAEVLQSSDPTNVYKGTTLDTTGGHSYLLSANFHSGKIDVFKGDAGAPDLTGKFTDPGLPSGFAPFNVATLNGKVYVTYALQGAGKDDMPGFGNGFVSVFDLNGNFLGRVASRGTLDSPWGLEIAPSSFGAFAGDLLVGNFGDGRINAFDLSSNSFVGQLLGTDGMPLTIDGLWGLKVGNNASGGSSQRFTFPPVLTTKPVAYSGSSCLRLRPRSPSPSPPRSPCSPSASAWPAGGGGRSGLRCRPRTTNHNAQPCGGDVLPRGFFVGVRRSYPKTCLIPPVLLAGLCRPARVGRLVPDLPPPTVAGSSTQPSTRPGAPTVHQVGTVRATGPPGRPDSAGVPPFGGTVGPPGWRGAGGLAAILKATCACLGLTRPAAFADAVFCPTQQPIAIPWVRFILWMNAGRRRVDQAAVYGLAEVVNGC